MVASSPHLSLDQEEKDSSLDLWSAWCLTKTETHREDPGHSLHSEADEQEPGIPLMKFQSGDTP